MKLQLRANVALAIGLGLLSQASFAGKDMRLVALPDPAVQIKAFGYTAAEAKEMLAGRRVDLWEKVPKASWVPMDYTRRDRMGKALGTTGFETSVSNSIINVCKVYARDPVHCTVFASAVACAESSCGTRFDKSTNSIFGVNAGLKSVYKTRTDAVLDWVRRYNGTTATNGWYVANEGVFYQNCKYPTVGNPSKPNQKYLSYCDKFGTEFFTSFFYSDKPNYFPASEYCLSEKSSNSQNYCPNGYANSKAAYVKIQYNK